MEFEVSSPTTGRTPDLTGITFTSVASRRRWSVPRAEAADRAGCQSREMTPGGRCTAMRSCAPHTHCTGGRGWSMYWTRAWTICRQQMYRDSPQVLALRIQLEKREAGYSPSCIRSRRSILGARPRAGPSVSPYPKSESSRRGAESSSSHPSTFAPSSSGSTQCSIRNRHRRVRRHARARVRSCGYAGGGHPEAGARSDRGERLGPCVAASRTPLPDGIRCFTYP